MQQATVNLFADMGVQPSTLRAAWPPPRRRPTRPRRLDDDHVAGRRVDARRRHRRDDLGHRDRHGRRRRGRRRGVHRRRHDLASRDRRDPGASTSWTYAWVAHGTPAAVDPRPRGRRQRQPRARPRRSRWTSPARARSGATPSRPTQPDSGDGNAIELGVKFKSDTFGTIDGIRFYKSAANTGTHVGSLWTASGQKLASATFGSETASGWQDVTFSAPVAIQPNTVYVASYFAPNGHYAASSQYMYKPMPFGAGMLDSPPLHVLPANGTTENGVFNYSGRSAFPATGYRGDQLLGRRQVLARRRRPAPSATSAPSPVAARRPSPGPRRPRAACRRATRSRPTSARRPRRPRPCRTRRRRPARGSRASRRARATRSASRRPTPRARARPRRRPTRSRRPPSALRAPRPT